MIPPWLPGLLLLESCNGDWTQYVENVYAQFKQDFVDSKPTFQGHRLRLKRYPIDQGKESTFWHMISEGKIEADRIPDLRRCERIGWPKLLIERVPSAELRMWAQNRNNESRIAIAVDDFSYIVVLAERHDDNGVYYLPWTAFYVEHTHSRKKFEKEWTANRI
jgi:hypothetical protein